MSTAIGIDIGGTKVSGGVLDEEGRILVRTRRDTPDRSNAPRVVEDTIVEVIEELLAQAEEAGVEAPATVGVGAAGFVAAGVPAGLKNSGGKDVALVVNQGPTFDSASVFTANRCKANPILWSQEVVKDGTVKAFELWNPSDLGYLAGYAAASLASGITTIDTGAKFTAGKLGEYTVLAPSGTTGPSVVLGPPTVFDSSNIDKFNF